MEKRSTLRNSALRRRFASNRSNGWKWLAVTENRNRLFQIRAPTYSPTHPPTIRASLSTSTLTKAKLEPTYPLLCKSTRLDVTHALPRFSRRYFPSSSSSFSTLPPSLSFEIVRRTTKDRSNERNNPLEEGSGGLRTTRRKRRIAKCTFEIHPIEKYLNGGILVLVDAIVGTIRSA